jgi:hypothetical protein
MVQRILLAAVLAALCFPMVAAASDTAPSPPAAAPTSKPAPVPPLRPVSKPAPSPIASAQESVAPAPAVPDLSVRLPSLATSTPVAPTSKGGFRPSRALAWGMIGGGSALVATGLATAFASRGKSQGSRDAQQNPSLQSASPEDAKSNDIWNFSREAGVLMGAGAVTTGVGAWLLFRSGNKVGLAPKVGRSQAGLVAIGRF